MPAINHDPHLSTHCAIAARQHETPLCGTAPRVDVWFLLEYPLPWGSHATTHNDLPPAVMDTLQAQVEASPNARLQFIKREERQTFDNLTLYIALVNEQQPVLYEITLGTITDLLQLDFAAFLQRDPAVAQYRTAQPLFLVCTNNQRDSCCARGLPIYDTLRHHEGIAVWQTTHIGGHRYAATLIAFPHSIYYGHVEVTDVAAIVTAQNQGQVHLPKMRGRTCYEPVVQAAETFLRAQSTQTTIEVLHLHTVTSTSNDDEWLVSFHADGRPYDLRLTRQLTAYQLPKSCQKEPGPVYEFHLVDDQAG